MRNLLKCEFTRLTRSVFFWIITGFCVLWPIITALFYHGILAFTFTATGIGFEDVELPKEMLRYLTWMISVSFITELPKFSALFACIHIGREYTDGIVRNKIIAGHSRTKIYLSYVLTQLAANAFLCIVYIGASLFGLWISGLGVEVNGGEMFLRLGVGIVVFLTLSLIFIVLATIFRRRALPLILSIVIAMISTTAAAVIGNFNLPSKAVDDYIELRSESYEDLVDMGYFSNREVEKLEEEYDKDYYVGLGWKIFHPAYVVTPIGFESDYQASSAGILFGSSMEYTDEINFTEDFYESTFYDKSMLSPSDIDDLDSMHVSYGTLNLIYLAKCFVYMIFIGGWGLFIFRKKNMF
ncbi:MAG: ABC transporter permease [Clostridiales bacterium]|nr:ABC transporter permease [Clostridiales bacterium]